MSSSTEFLLYVTVYRLSVLAIGALSIYLGFRLFRDTDRGEGLANNAGTASAEGGNFKLTMTSILPGTYFALFGTVIIGIMVWRGEPQWQEHKTTETIKANKEVVRVKYDQRQRTDPKISLDGPPTPEQEEPHSGDRATAGER
ncbi:MAG: hypothetical protein SD837_15400 [Candidatus Electrothrix scaldis]|nr:MAG: hypothetical protein SD837_15400 [Candidatus Electrothrix sp. GW3-3]